MIIVADSGSTKTDWALITDNGVEYVQNIGLNPYFLTKDELAKGIYSALKNVDMNEVEGVYFYGAGTGAAENKEKLKNVFVDFFPGAKEIVVDTDMLGAAKALFGQEKGIACILGTGSNSCYYDGEKIANNVNSLGYLLGDNGSGAVLGKRLLTMYMQNKLNASATIKLKEEYDVQYRSVIENVYKKSTPNKYFASFSPFVLANIQDKDIEAMVREEFTDFVEYFILPYEGYKNMPIRVVGSIGHYYSDIINDVFSKYGLKVDKVSRKPIEALVEYYSQFVGA